MFCHNPEVIRAKALKGSPYLRRGLCRGGSRQAHV